MAARPAADERGTELAVDRHLKVATLKREQPLVQLGK
jgi:hypothetical protein